MAKWLSKYEQGGLVLKQKTKDNYDLKANPNNVQASVGPGYVGLGYNTKGRNYSPAWGGQFQNGGKKKKKDIQDKVEDWLGNPMQKAEITADKYTKPGEDQVDNIRHPMAGRYVSEAIQNKLYNIPGISQIAGFLGASAAGLGHELVDPNRGAVNRPYSLYDTFKEGAEDQFNNMIGAAIGSTPFISKDQKDKVIKYLSDKNMLPDGYRDKDNMYRKHDMGGKLQNGDTLPEKVLLHDPKPEGDHQYSLKKTVTPYKTNQQIKKNTKAPINPDDVDFLYNYRHFGGEGSDYRNKTAVPTEGDRHWNIPRFIADPQFGAKYEALNDTDDSIEAERRNVLADMFKYQMYQHPEQSRGKSFRQAKRFVRNEIDPIVNGPFFQFYTDKDKYQPYSNKFLDTFANDNPFITSADSTTSPMSDDEMEKISTDYLRNIKKLSKKETKEQIKKWKADRKSLLESIEKPIVQTGEMPVEFAMGGSLPGAVGFTYARTAGAAPSNGKYAKKTKASAQNGKVLDPKADDRVTLDFNNSDPAFQYVRANSFVPFDTKDFEGIKQNIAGYMKSPLYSKRLSLSIPDQELAKDVQQQRLDNLLSVKLNPKSVDRGTDYNPITNRVNIGASDFVDNPSIAHEVAHGMIPNRTLSYGKQNLLSKAANVVGDLFQPFEQFSKSELEKINIPLSGRVTAPNASYQRAIQEEHYAPQGSRASTKTAAGETYGDLTGMRQLLLDNGITTEFGQDLTPELWEKAKKNPKIKNQPGMQRMMLKFNDEDIIKMNNEVARLNGAAPLTQAQNGKEMSFYQQGLDFTPKNISKNGSVIKDDMGQWAHPGEITEINSNDITMEGVDYPVLGISDTGDVQMMYPDQDYKFDGKKVTEFPMMEKGGWLNKYTPKAQTGITTSTASGTTDPTVQLITQEDIKKAKKKAEADTKEAFAAAVKRGRENQAYISKDRSTPASRAADQQMLTDAYMAEAQRNSPLAQTFASWAPGGTDVGTVQASQFSKTLPIVAGGAAGMAVLPEVLAGLAANIGGIPGLTGNNIINAGLAYQGLTNIPNVASSISNAYENPTWGNVGDATAETVLTGLNVLPFAATVAPEVRAAIEASKESGLLSKAHNYNPWQWQPEETSAFRMIGGEPGVEDLVISGKVRPSVKGSDIGKIHEETSYSLGVPYNDVVYPKYGRQFNRPFEGPYMVEVPNYAENAALSYGPAGKQLGAQAWTYPNSQIGINDVNLYKKHWLKGQQLLKSKLANAAEDATGYPIGYTSTTMLDKVLGRSPYRDRVFDAAKTLFQQVVGKYKKGEENKAAIAEGNEWLKNWIQSEATKDKLTNRARSISYSFSQHPDIVSKIRTLQNFTPVTSEYPIRANMDDFLGILMGGKEEMVHQGNIGVAHRYPLSFSSDQPKFRIGDKSSGPGTWINRATDISAPQRTSTTIHEGVHDWFRHEPLTTFGYKDLIRSSITDDALAQNKAWLKSGSRGTGLGYYADPTEVHARIMQTRHYFGLTPETHVTPKMAEDMLKIIEKGNTPIKSKFPSVFDDYKKAANLFNKLPAVVPVAVGVGALGAAGDTKQEQKNGGWLNKYK